MAFPTNPSNSDEYNGYKYISNLDLWEKKRDEDWAYKEGPMSVVSDYTIRWDRGYQEGNSLDATSNTDYIQILKDGLYEIRTVARLIDGASVTYMSIGLNGSRNDLMNQSNVFWNHDDSRVTNSYTESNFLGRLQAGDIITSGPRLTYDDISIGVQSHKATLKIVRIA